MDEGDEQVSREGLAIRRRGIVRHHPADGTYSQRLHLVLVEAYEEWPDEDGLRSDRVVKNVKGQRRRKVYPEVGEAGLPEHFGRVGMNGKLSLRDHPGGIWRLGGLHEQVAAVRTSENDADDGW